MSHLSIDMEESDGSQCHEEAMSISSDTRTTYGLINGNGNSIDPRRNVQSTYKTRMKMLGSVLLCASLIAGSAGYIAAHHNSTEVVKFPAMEESVNLDSNLRSDLKSQPAKINVVTLKARNDKDFTPMTAKLTQAQPVNVESSQSQPSTINQQSVPIANNVTTNTAISAPVVPSTSVSNDADIQSSPNNRPKTKKIPKANKHKQLPPDAATKHPVSLLNEMHNVINPQYTYYECFQERTIIGYRAELTVTLTNGTESFLSTAIGKKKKDAKRFAAEKACNQLWQLIYPEEEVEGIAAIKEACENHAKLIVLPSQALETTTNNSTHV